MMKAVLPAVVMCLSPCVAIAQKTIITHPTPSKTTPKPRPKPKPGPKPKPAIMSAAERQRLVDNLMGNMVYVEGGTFTMGGTEPVEEDKSAFKDHPQHKVTLSSFNIGKYEVTQGEWTAVMGKNPSRIKGNSLPVSNVQWDDCQKFIAKLNAMTRRNFRLPTEAEWEYAARGGKMSHGYKYAGGDNLGEVAWYKDNSSGRPHAVGQKQPNELGLYDMMGNVSEWCQDALHNYVPWPTVDPLGFFGSLYAYRGGNFTSRTDSIYVAFREYHYFEEYQPRLGLRLVESPEGKNPKFQVWENHGYNDFVGYVDADGHRTEGIFHYKGNKKNADGTFYNGEMYEGTLKKYYWPNSSTVTDTYDHGKYTYASGSVFEGYYDDNRNKAKGKMTWTSGNSFEGEWKGNRIYHGKYTYKDGTVYEGYYDYNGNKTKGKMTWTSGDYFEGEFHNNSRYHGKYYDAHNHQTFTGYFDSNGNFGQGKWE